MRETAGNPYRAVGLDAAGRSDTSETDARADRGRALAWPLIVVTTLLQLRNVVHVLVDDADWNQADFRSANLLGAIMVL